MDRGDKDRTREGEEEGGGGEEADRVTEEQIKGAREGWMERWRMRERGWQR